MAPLRVVDILGIDAATVVIILIMMLILIVLAFSSTGRHRHADAADLPADRYPARLRPVWFGILFAVNMQVSS